MYLIKSTRSYTRYWGDSTHIFFFFFQAEDGIRDIGVTGVRRVLFRSPASVGKHSQCFFNDLLWTLKNGQAFVRVQSKSLKKHCECLPTEAGSAFPALSTNSAFRSEERRVGKESRSRWSPYH